MAYRREPRVKNKIFKRSFFQGIMKCMTLISVRLNEEERQHVQVVKRRRSIIFHRYIWWFLIIYHFLLVRNPGPSLLNTSVITKTTLPKIQIVWADTTSVGIGYAQSADAKKRYVVARYYPGGNFFGKFRNNVFRSAHLASHFQLNCHGKQNKSRPILQQGYKQSSDGKSVAETLYLSTLVESYAREKSKKCCSFYPSMES